MSSVQPTAIPGHPMWREMPTTAATSNVVDLDLVRRGFSVATASSAATRQVLYELAGRVYGASVDQGVLSYIAAAAAGLASGTILERLVAEGRVVAAPAAAPISDIELDAEASRVFAQALLSPPAPTEELRRLFARSRRP